MSLGTFAQNLRKLREAREWTQEDLARVSGISRRTISRYEWDGVIPRSSNLFKLAHALGCTVEVLMTGRESPNHGRQERRRKACELIRELDRYAGRRF